MTALNDRTRLTGYLSLRGFFPLTYLIIMSVQFTLPDGFSKSKLLLHSCCAPCSTACIEALAEFFDITVYYYNPNITCEAEYQKRKSEQIRYLQSLDGVGFLEGDYLVSEFYQVAKGLEGEKEGGARCEQCIGLRLRKTQEMADRLGFDYFCSTLSVSPHKNAKFINEYGKSLNGTSKYLENDFKKNNGYLRSITLSKQFGLYRQTYCGCSYSIQKEEK